MLNPLRATRAYREARAALTANIEKGVQNNGDPDIDAKIHSLILAGYTSDVKEVASAYGLDLKGICFRKPVSYDVKVPDDTTMIGFLVETGLRKEHFGPATYHALLKYLIQGVPMEDVISVIGVLIPLEFDLEYCVDDETVLERLARGLVKDGPLGVMVKPEKVHTLFDLFLNLGCRLLVPGVRRDALRILARDRDTRQKLLLMLKHFPVEARLHYYRLVGAYTLLTNSASSKTICNYQINVTAETMQCAVAHWNEAIENCVEPNHEHPHISATSLFTQTQIIHTKEALEALSGRANAWEFIQEALLIIHTYEGSVSHSVASAILSEWTTFNMLSASQKLQLVAYLDECCSPSNYQMSSYLSACPEWDNTVTLCDLVPYIRRLLSYGPYTLQSNTFEVVFSKLIKPHLEEYKATDIKRQVGNIDCILSQSVLFSFFSLSLKFVPDMMDNMKFYSLLENLYDYGATVGWPAKSAVYLERLYALSKQTTNSEYTRFLELAEQSCCCILNMDRSTLPVDSMFARRPASLSCQAARVLATKCTEQLSRLPEVTIYMPLNRPIALKSFIEIHSANN